MTERNDIEELFASVFEGAEMTPPDSVKEAIDASIFSTPAAGKRKGAWWIWPLVLVVLLGGGSTLYYFTGSATEEHPQHAEETGNPHTTAENAVTQNSQSSPEAILSTQAAQGEEFISQASESVSPNRMTGTPAHTAGDGQRKPAVGTSQTTFELVDDLEDENLADASDSKDLGVPEVEDVTLRDSEGDYSVDGHTEPMAETPQASELLVPEENSVEERVAEEAQPPIDNGRVEQAPKQNPWLISAYAGTSFGFNTLRGTSDLKLEEQAGVYASVEAIYPFSRSFSVSGGIDFSQRIDRLIQSSSYQDSIFVGNDIIYVYDSSQVVVDTLITPIYEPTTIQSELAGRVRFYSIGIPIYLHYQMELGRILRLDLSVGVRCAYMKYTNEDLVPNLTYPETYKQFGVNVSFRPELLIPINRVQLGVYGRFEYDALHGMQWNAITRTRWSAGFGMSARYKL